MDSSWNLDKSPYDLLGVQENATSLEVKQAYRDLARLFHPDRNHGLESTTERTEHFMKIKKAYDVLSDMGTRKLYDGCLYAKERLVRKNLYKFAVSNSPEFRDVVDEQFREAVLDPEEEIAGDALVLCCESCGAPSKFRCSLCDMLVCAFCTLKQHAKDGIPPHYPSQYSPRFRRQIESDGRRTRLLKNQTENAIRPWARTQERKSVEQRTFKQISKKVGEGEIAGASAAHARLATCYGWVQSAGAVHVAVWVQGRVDQVDVELVGSSPRLRMQQRGGKFAPVVDREFFGAVDLRYELECVTFAAMSVIVVKALKAVVGQRWPALFRGDSLLLRDAGDHNAHDWTKDPCEPDDEPDPAFLLDVHVPRVALPEHMSVSLSARCVSVSIEGWGRWTRHFVFDCRPDDATWCLSDVDGRRVVQFTLYFSNLPRETEERKMKRAPVDMRLVKELLVEDQDELFTLALAQVAARLDYGDLFMREEDLVEDASRVLASMRRDRPRHERKQPLFRPWSDAEQREAATYAQSAPPGHDQHEPIRRWHARAAIQDERDWQRARGLGGGLDDLGVPPSRPLGASGREETPPEAHHARPSAPAILVDANADALPTAPHGTRGAPKPLRFVTPAPAVTAAVAASTPTSTSPAPEAITTFAWDGAESATVKLYLSLGRLVDERLAPEDVLVRFESKQVKVSIARAGGPAPLVFERALFDSVVPSKCTFKLNLAKKVVVLGLRKKRKDLTWPSLSKDVNAIDTRDILSKRVSAE